MDKTKLAVFGALNEEFRKLDKSLISASCQEQGLMVMTISRHCQNCWRIHIPRHAGS